MRGRDDLGRRDRPRQEPTQALVREDRIDRGLERRTGQPTYRSERLGLRPASVVATEEVEDLAAVRLQRITEPVHQDAALGGSDAIETQGLDHAFPHPVQAVRRLTGEQRVPGRGLQRAREVATGRPAATVEESLHVGCIGLPGAEQLLAPGEQEASVVDQVHAPRQPSVDPEEPEDPR